MRYKFRFKVGSEKQRIITQFRYLQRLKSTQQRLGQADLLDRCKQLYKLTYLLTTTDAKGVAPGKAGYTPIYYFNRPPNGIHYYST
ncbi:MAG: hypothetical protein ABI045_02505 [Flavobacteriales bacterium]